MQPDKCRRVSLAWFACAAVLAATLATTARPVDGTITHMSAPIMGFSTWNQFACNIHEVSAYACMSMQPGIHSSHATGHTCSHTRAHRGQAACNIREVGASACMSRRAHTHSHTHVHACTHTHTCTSSCMHASCNTSMHKTAITRAPLREHVSAAILDGGR